jgi:hypothetical protein
MGKKMSEETLQKLVADTRQGFWENAGDAEQKRRKLVRNLKNAGYTEAAEQFEQKQADIEKKQKEQCKKYIQDNGGEKQILVRQQERLANMQNRNRRL